MSVETIARLHIYPDDMERAIWRRVDGPLTASREMLHHIVQAAPGWDNRHLWHVEAGDRRYGIPDSMFSESSATAGTNVKIAILIAACGNCCTPATSATTRPAIAIETVGSGDPDVRFFASSMANGIVRPRRSVACLASICSSMS